MKITMKAIKGHLIYSFYEGSKLVGLLGLYQKGKKTLTAAELLESIR